MSDSTKQDEIPKEHERRFSPNLKTFRFDTNLYPFILITQAYLEDELRTRIRSEFSFTTGYTFSQTRKTGEGVSRNEDECQITKQEYDKMLASAAYTLTKRRYFMPSGKCVTEVNFFEGNLEGYIQIEVEGATAEEVEAFVPPDWFGTEVTHDKRHDNYSLAKFGCKELLK